MWIDLSLLFLPGSFYNIAFPQQRKKMPKNAEVDNNNDSGAAASVGAVAAGAAGGEFGIEVTDDGCGIVLESEGCDGASL